MFCAHLTVHSFIGFGFHYAIIPPSPIPLPSPIPHVSWDTLLGLTLGAKYSKTVLGPFGFQFIGKGNDSGFIIPHISIPPANALLPIIIAFGSSKPMFSSSQVILNVDGQGLPMTAAMLGATSYNQACNDPCNMPLDFVIAPNTVLVGFTWGDVLAGFGGMVLDSALSFLTGKLGGWITKQAGGVLSNIMNRIDGKVVASAIFDSFVERYGRQMAVMLLGDSAEAASRGIIREYISDTSGKLIGNGLGNGFNYIESNTGSGNTNEASTPTPHQPPSMESETAPPIFEAI